MRLIDTRALPAVPWKNGGGVTRTLAASPEGAGFDDFDWRVSIADVRESGSFSAFPGVERTILLLEGHGMMLHGEGSVYALTAPFEPYRMAGDRPVDAELVGGSARDFNVMVRRGRADAAVRIWRDEDSAPPADAALYYCPQGEFKIGPALLPAGWACFVADGRSNLSVAPKARDAVLIGVLLDFPASKGSASKGSEGDERCTG